MLAACQQFGPLALEQGRERYNETIHSTSRDQLFANIIRVANGESPLFMDVAEVNASQSFQNTLTGGVGGIGTLLGLQGAGPSVPTSATAGSLSTRVVPNQAGSVSGGVLYSESPTIAYQPLSGQALVQQISTPIDISSIANLINSDWPHLPVLDWAFDRVAPNHGQYFVAVDAMVSLLDNGVLIVAAEKSQAMPREPSQQVVASGTNITVQTSSPPEQKPDALVLYFQPDYPPGGLEQAGSGVIEQRTCDSAGGLNETPWPSAVTADTKPFAADLSLRKRGMLHDWIKLLRIYSDTQGEDFLTKLVAIRQPAPGAKARDPAGDTNSLARIDALLAAIDDKISSMSMQELEGYLSILPRRLELRTSAVPPAPQTTSRQANKNRGVAQPPSNAAPVITTHSALGILLNAAGTTIEFMTPSEFEWTYQRPTKRQPTYGLSSNFYTLEIRNENSLCTPSSSPYCLRFDRDKDNPTSTETCVNKFIEKYHDFEADSFSIKEDVKNYETLALENRLGSMRRYLMIVVDDAAPPDAFVSLVYHGKTFYIDGRDEISRKNFALLNQFMTMMAVPSQGSPLTPTINVGGTR